MTDPATVRAFLEAHTRFLVVGHEEPDGDCLASEIAVGRLVRVLGGHALLLSAGPFDRPEIEELADRFLASVPPPVGGGAAAGGTAVIIVDCSTPDRTGRLAPSIAGLPSLVIDHHSSGEAFGDTRFVDPAAPSTSLLVLRLLEAFGIMPDRETAQFILFGLCTDTGFFRHLAAGSAETFRAVARLVELGTSTAEAYQMMYGRRSLAGRKLLATALLRTESRRGDSLLVAWQTLADREGISGASRGEEDLYQLLQTVKGNRVVAFLKEEEPGSWSVGLRSVPGIDVGAVARGFGGGGHRQAAGCDLTGTLETVRAAVVEALERLL